MIGALAVLILGRMIAGGIRRGSAVITAIALGAGVGLTLYGLALADQLDELNRSRRDLQEQMQVEAMQQVNGLLETLRHDDLPLCLCLHDASWHQGECCKTDSGGQQLSERTGVRLRELLEERFLGAIRRVVGMPNRCGMVLMAGGSTFISLISKGNMSRKTHSSR